MIIVGMVTTYRVTMVFVMVVLVVIEIKIEIKIKIMIRWHQWKQSCTTGCYIDEIYIKHIIIKQTLPMGLILYQKNKGKNLKHAWEQ